MPTPPRRRAAPVLAAFAAGAVLCATPAVAFDLEDVVERARALAARPYDDPAGRVPAWLLELDYDRYRDIRFRPERALWRTQGRRFQVQFFHPGFLYDRSVRVHEVRAGKPVPVAFSPDQFDYGQNEFGSRVPQDLGYAGLRVHYPIKRESYHDEVAVFLGASYFRAVGRELVYGLSARGVAIDTAVSSGEEFPWFREFWLVQPRAGAMELTIYALLDSPSTTGAYRFVVAPGPQTRMDVELRLFPREQLGKLGVAPLTSMYLRGENAVGQGPPDFRPEVHDSDGLLIASRGGEWLWRPLDNPADLSVVSFALSRLAGFGLLQRDRGFDRYQDIEARPDLRPSVWVEPKGEWGPGRVELVEIPTRDDTNDNVVAYWVPQAEARPGSPVAFAYSLHWYGDDRGRPPAGRSAATRIDAGTREDARRVIVDFEGEALRRLPEDSVLEGVVSVTPPGGDGPQAGQILEQQVIRNPVSGGFRLVFQLRRPEDDPVELRAFLRHGADAVTETWSYLLRP